MARDKEKISSTILGISVRLFINVLLVFFLMEGFVTGYQFSNKLFSDTPFAAASKETMEITIESGTSVMELAELLDDKKIVDGKYLFVARAYLGKYNSKIQAGTYILGPGMSPDEICRKVCGMKGEDAS